MSIPAYLDSSVYAYSYYENTTVLADVETGGVGMITQLRAMLVTTLGWTEPSTALFKTPVDGSGRFLDVLVTRIDATHIEWRVRNQAAVTVCTRRMALGTGQMRIFGNTAGVFAEFLQTNQNISQHCSAHLLDMAPDATGDHTLYVFGAGYLNASNTQDSQGDAAGRGFMIDNGSAAAVDRGGPYNERTDGNILNLIDSSNRFYFRECNMSANFAGTVRWAGRIVHALLCDVAFSGGNERKVYIDTSTVATFKVTGLTVNGSSIHKLMMRKG